MSTNNYRLTVTITLDVDTREVAEKCEFRIVRFIKDSYTPDIWEIESRIEPALTAEGKTASNANEE